MDDERQTELEAQIRNRLKNICSHLPADDFTQLIEGIAHNARKAEQRVSIWGPGPPGRTRSGEAGRVAGKSKQR